MSRYIIVRHPSNEFCDYFAGSKWTPNKSDAKVYKTYNGARNKFLYLCHIRNIFNQKNNYLKILEVKNET